MLTAKPVDGRNCSSTQERGGNYGRQQQIMAFTQDLRGLGWVFSNYVKWEHRFFFPLNMINQKERKKKIIGLEGMCQIAEPGKHS